MDTNTGMMDGEEISGEEKPQPFKSRRPSVIDSDESETNDSGDDDLLRNKSESSIDDQNTLRKSLMKDTQQLIRMAALNFFSRALSAIRNQSKENFLPTESIQN